MARILVVEDDADVRLVMEHVLVDGGYEVDAAGLLANAFELLDTHAYDLVVADARMPDGNGLELAKQASQTGIPVLVITGYAFNLSQGEVKCFELLLKPVRPSELLQAVERALQDAKSRQEQP